MAVKYAERRETLANMIEPRREESHRGYDKIYERSELGGAHHVVRLLGRRLDKNAKVLEIGAGACVSSIYLAKTTGCRVLALEMSDKAIEIARRNLKSAGLTERDVAIIPADFIKSRINGQFDSITVNNVLHEFDENTISKIVDRLCDLTKPGGYNAITYWIRYREIGIENFQKIEKLYIEKNWKILDRGSQETKSLFSTDAARYKYFLAQKPTES